MKSRICGEGKNEPTETHEEKETETVVQQMDEASTSSRDASTSETEDNQVSDEIDRKILKLLEKIEPDEDEAFFISVLSSVRQFSADDKLHFRMIVLKAIKDIKTCSGCQFSMFDTNTFSKQFTWHRHSSYSELDSNSRNILTLPQTTATPSPMQTFLDLDG